MANILEIVHRIENALAGRSPGYVFRGEPACFEKVSSGLYRTYELEKGEEGFTIEKVEDELVEKARSFTDRKDRFDILCEIQHRGGKTNQIDFTRDLGVALFFACGTAAGREREPGRVIMLDDSDTARQFGISIRDITHPIHMAAAQKSVFVSTDSGYLDDRHLPHVQVWTIDADDKQTLLDHLKSARGIDSRSVFMDISGFIRNEHQFENANAWFYRSKKMFLDGDLDGAIEAASKHLSLVRTGFDSDPGLHLRGQAYIRKGDRERAFQDLRRVRRVKLRLRPDAPEFFRRIAPYERPAYPLPDDIQKPLDEWCEKQEQIQKEASRRDREAQNRNPEQRMLQCSIGVVPEGSVEESLSLTFNVFTDTGYAYRQTFPPESTLLMTWPSTFLDHDATCWWSFYGPLHQHVSVAGRSVPEDIEVSVPPKPGTSATPCTVQVKFFAYDPRMQQLKKRDSGEYEIVTMT